MKRKRLTLTELIKENKEEILRDNAKLNKIEKRLDERMGESKNNEQNYRNLFIS